MEYLEDIIGLAEKGNSFDIFVNHSVVERDRSDGSTRREITVSTGDRLYLAKDYWADENEAKEDSAEIIDAIRSELDRNGITYAEVSLGIIAVNPVHPVAKSPTQHRPYRTPTEHSLEELEALRIFDYTAHEASLVTPAAETDLVREHGKAFLSYQTVLNMGIRMGQSREETLRKMFSIHRSNIDIYLEGQKERQQKQPGKEPASNGKPVQGTLFDMDNLF